MPLLDHFHVPPGDDLSWDSFHSTWPICMTQLLNGGQLPPRYRAAPHVHFGVTVETDVVTFEKDDPPVAGPGEENGAVATAVWAPPRPTLDVSVEFIDLDVFEVKVYQSQGTRAFVAAIELVSPANKDRPAHRLAFATKCAAYLQQGISVIVVDVVTERRDSLHGELMRRMQLGDEASGIVSSELYAVAYRTRGIGTRMRLEAWPAALALGATLPVLPLWLSHELAVPLDLEASYVAACKSLRISW